MFRHMLSSVAWSNSHAIHDMAMYVFWYNLKSNLGYVFERMKRNTIVWRGHRCGRHDAGRLSMTGVVYRSAVGIWVGQEVGRVSS